MLLSDCPVRQFGKPVLSMKVSGFKVLKDLLLEVYILVLLKVNRSSSVASRKLNPPAKRGLKVF